MKHKAVKTIFMLLAVVALVAVLFGCSDSPAGKGVNNIDQMPMAPAVAGGFNSTMYCNYKLTDGVFNVSAKGISFTPGSSFSELSNEKKKTLGTIDTDKALEAGWTIEDDLQIDGSEPHTHVYTLTFTKPGSETYSLKFELSPWDVLIDLIPETQGYDTVFMTWTAT